MKFIIPASQALSFLDNMPIPQNDETRALRGKPLVIEIKESRPKHTPEQQAKYWATLHEWGREQGYTVKETEAILHNHVLCEAFGIEKMIEVGGARWPVPKHRSSDSDVEEYSILIETLERLQGL